METNYHDINIWNLIEASEKSGSEAVAIIFYDSIAEMEIIIS